jgi:hypothetical protein
MKISKELLLVALADACAQAAIAGFQTGDEEYVTVLEMEDQHAAMRFMASLALRLNEVETPAGVRASVAAARLVHGKGRTIVRFPGWQLGC